MPALIAFYKASSPARIYDLSVEKGTNLFYFDVAKLSENPKRHAFIVTQNELLRNWLTEQGCLAKELAA